MSETKQGQEYHQRGNNQEYPKGHGLSPDFLNKLTSEDGERGRADLRKLHKAVEQY